MRCIRVLDLHEIRLLTAAGMICAVAAGSATLTKAIGKEEWPEPFGLLEDQDLAFCKKTASPAGEACVCSAAGIEGAMTFEEFDSYLLLDVESLALMRSIKMKLKQWTRYCGGMKDYRNKPAAALNHKSRGESHRFNF
jgi:hypothetical protein